MKILLLLGLFTANQLVFAAAPSQIAGFVLNSDIKDYDAFVRSETALPIRFVEALEEVEIHNVPGFKSGYIAYGTCHAPGKIVRIKLKYSDWSKSFYQKLLDAYKEKFGKPIWLGDVFHVNSIWKWTFSEGETQVNLFLQHNLGKKDEKLGTSVKLTHVSQVEMEQACFDRQNPNFRKSTTDQEDTKIDWEKLLPR